MKWFEGVLDRDRKDAAIQTLVVGMHEALPESISANHSMNEYPSGIESGRRVYAMLLDMQNDAHKIVYVLSSHSHYFMDGIFNTEYWKAHGGVAGVDCGNCGRGHIACRQTQATLRPPNRCIRLLDRDRQSPGEPRGTIQFNFEEFTEESIPADVVQRFTKPFVRECFAGNRNMKPITLNHRGIESLKTTPPDPLRFPIFNPPMIQ
jgi:hypothetical protein